MGKSVAVCIAVLYGLLLASPTLVWGDDGHGLPGLHFGIRDGLPSNTVYDVYRTADGMLWFATDKGIARYDGRRFQVYTTYDGLPDNEIFFFQEDRQERLWLATYSGALCYYQHGQFHTAQNTPWLRIPVPQAHIRFLIRNDDGSLTIIYSNSYQLLIVRGDHCQTLDAGRFCRLPRELPLYAAPLADGTIHVVTSYRSLVADRDLRVLEKEMASWRDMLRYIQTNRQACFLQDSQILDRHLHPVGVLPDVADEQVRKVLLYSGRYAVGTPHRLFVGSQQYEADVASLETDAYNRLWVGTLNDGAYCLDRNPEAVEAVPATYSGAIRLAFTRGDSLLFFATTAGRWYRAGKDGPLEAIPVLFPAEAEDVRAVSDWGSRGLFAATRTHILQVGPDGRRRPRTIEVLPQDLQPKEIHVAAGALFIRGAGTAMVCSETAHATDSTVHLLALATPWERTYAAAVDSQGLYWLSTVRGLYAFAENHIRPVRFRAEEALRWFQFSGGWRIGCTQGNVLTLYLQQRGREARASIRQRTVWTGATRLDDTHLLLHTTDRYQLLTLLSGPGRPAVVLRTLDDPRLPQRAAVIRVLQGVCCFLSEGRLVRVPVRRLLEPLRVAPQVRFRQLEARSRTAWIAGTRQLVLSYAAARRIRLSYDVVAPAGTQPLVEYEVARDGSGEWLPAPEGQLDLVELRSGRYEIRIRARTIGGAYGPPARLYIDILKPWWARTGVLLAAFGVLAAVVGLGARYQTRWVLRRREERHAAHIRLLQSEYKALNALMHPHFVFNSLNTIQALVNAGNPATASEYIGVFAKLVRQNLRHAKAGLITLEQELELVALYIRLEQLRFKTPLQYAVRVDDALDLDDLEIPPLLVQPLVENALLHGLLPKGGADLRIEVQISRSAGRIRIDVEDNGVGVETAGAGSSADSIGLYATQERLDRLNAVRGLGYDFRIVALEGPSGTKRGTRASIFLPGG